MQVGQIKERLTKIEQYLDDAAQACQMSVSVPEDLRNYLGELERESDQAIRMAELETDEGRFVECVDRLEALGDRAMRSCAGARAVDKRVQDALTRAHDMLSSLKHQLH